MWKRLIRGCISKRQWNLYQPSWQQAWLLRLASAAAEGKLKFGKSAAALPVQTSKKKKKTGGQKLGWIFSFIDAILESR